jgi:hypothetical protein
MTPADLETRNEMKTKMVSALARLAGGLMVLAQGRAHLAQ